MIGPAGERGRGLSETNRFRAACDGVKRVIHEGTRRTTKTHEARSRGGPEPFRAPDRPSGFPVFLSNDPPRRQGGGKTCLKQQKKESSTKTHEGRRRATKKDPVVDSLKGNAPWVRVRENAASQLPVPQPLVLGILSILFNDVSCFFIHIDAQDLQD